jgi:cyanophycinase
MDLDSIARALPNGSGPLGLLSGDEFLKPVQAFDRKLLQLAGKRVGVIYCADHRAQPQSERFAAKHFGTLGAESFTLDMHTDRLPEFDLAYIAGGSPKDLLEHLRNSATWPLVLERWRSGKGLAGSSAGAMVLCERTLTPKPGARVPTEWTNGVGPVDAIGLAVHASTRPREWLHEVARTAPVPLLALDDRTGVIFSDGASETIGPGNVWFIDSD